MFACQLGHPTCTKPSQVHLPTVTLAAFPLLSHHPERAAAAQELRVQVTNIQTPKPPVTSCVTLANSLTSLCLSYKMGEMVPNHKIMMQIRGINACKVLRSNAWHTLGT